MEMALLEDSPIEVVFYDSAISTMMVEQMR
jgi:hypothetical protein